MLAHNWGSIRRREKVRNVMILRTAGGRRYIVIGHLVGDGKSKKQIPRGLKSARDDKNKGLRRGPEGLLYPNHASNRVFQQPLKSIRCESAAMPSGKIAS
jgi:hypothetical protein